MRRIRSHSALPWANPSALERASEPSTPYVDLAPRAVGSTNTDYARIMTRADSMTELLDFKKLATGGLAALLLMN